MSKRLIKVGTLKLTRKTSKRVFHLPIEQAVLVPSTSGIKSQRKISKSELDRRVRGVRQFLGSRFGGFTSVRGTGGFVLKGGKVVKEKIVRVSTFGTKADFKKHRASIIRKMGSYARTWKQESVGYEHEGDLFIISPMRKVKKIRKRVNSKKR